MIIIIIMMLVIREKRKMQVSKFGEGKMIVNRFECIYNVIQIDMRRKDSE